MTGCLVVSQLFNVAIHVRCSKVGSKLTDFTLVGYLTPKLSSLSTIAKGFYVYIYIHIRLSATGVLNSLQESCIYAYVVAGNSPLDCSTHKGCMYKMV